MQQKYCHATFQLALISLPIKPTYQSYKYYTLIVFIKIPLINLFKDIE